jgi:hypothetical protein
MPTSDHLVLGLSVVPFPEDAYWHNSLEVSKTLLQFRPLNAYLHWILEDITLKSLVDVEG